MASAQTRTRPLMQLCAHPKPHLRLKSCGHLASTQPGGLSPHHHDADRARFAGMPERSDAQGIEMAALAESEAEYIETEPAEVLAVGSAWSYLKVGA
jgi:hypothetical protein